MAVRRRCFPVIVIGSSSSSIARFFLMMVNGRHHGTAINSLILTSAAATEMSWCTLSSRAHSHSTPAPSSSSSSSSPSSSSYADVAVHLARRRRRGRRPHHEWRVRMHVFVQLHDHLLVGDRPHDHIVVVLQHAFLAERAPPPAGQRASRALCRERCPRSSSSSSSSLASGRRTARAVPNALIYLEARVHHPHRVRRHELQEAHARVRRRDVHAVRATSARRAVPHARVNARARRRSAPADAPDWGAARCTRRRYARG